MVVTCKVKGCGSVRQTNGVSLHRFPAKYERCMKWIQACGLQFLLKSEPIRAISRKYFVCEKHFTKDCFKQLHAAKLRLLNSNAVPTLNLVSKPKTINSVIESKEQNSVCNKQKPNTDPCGIPAVTVSVENNISYACISIEPEAISDDNNTSKVKEKNYTYSFTPIPSKSTPSIEISNTFTIFDGDTTKSIEENTISPLLSIDLPLIPVVGCDDKLKENSPHEQLLSPTSVFDGEFSSEEENVDDTNNTQEISSPPQLLQTLPSAADEISSFKETAHKIHKKYRGELPGSIVTSFDHLFATKTHSKGNYNKPEMSAPRRFTKKEIDFLKLCRLCANSSVLGGMIDLFSEAGIDTLNKIQQYLPIDVQEEDGYPHSICSSCCLKVDMCYDMISMCLSADTILQDLKQQKQLRSKGINVDIVHTADDLMECDSLPEVPMFDMEVPMFNMEVPMCNKEVPMCNMEVPMCNMEIPMCNKKGPMCNTEVPMCNMKGPMCNMKGPMCNMKGPMCNMEVPMCNMKVPMCNMKVPMCNMEVPMCNMEVPMFDMKIPMYDMEEVDNTLLEPDCNIDSLDTDSEQSDKSDHEEHIVFDDITLPAMPDIVASSCLHVPQIKTIAAILAHQRPKELSPRLSIVLINLKRIRKTKEHITEAATNAVNHYRQKNYVKGKPIKHEAQYNCPVCKFNSFDKFELEFHLSEEHQFNNCKEEDGETEPINVEHYLMPSYDSLQLGYFKTTLTSLSATHQAINTLGLALNHKKITSLPALKNKIEKPLKTFMSDISDIQLPDIFVHKEYKIQKKHFNVAVMCEICGDVVTSNQNLRRHIITKHKNKEDTGACCHCDRKVRPDKLQAHVENDHSTGKHLICKICDAQYALTGETQPHMYTESYKPFKCTVCLSKRGFLKLEGLNYHNKIKHESKKIAKTCDFCLRQFKCRHSLVAHINYHLEMIYTGRSEYVCEICGKIFDAHRKLVIHKSQIHTCKKVECPICHNFYRTKYMRIHLMRHNNVRFKCTQCPRSYSTITDLKYHELQHKGIGWCRCPICNDGFKSLALMEKHKKLHENNEPIVIPPYKQSIDCNICGKTCKDKYLLAKHMCVHTNIYPCYCSICNKAFKRKSGLRLHMEIIHLKIRKQNPVKSSEKSNDVRKHITEKKYQCQYCSKPYVSKVLLAAHENSKHLHIKTHFCDLCNASFYHPGSKNRHLHNIHGVPTGRKGEKMLIINNASDGKSQSTDGLNEPPDMLNDSFLGV